MTSIIIHNTLQKELQLVPTRLIFYEGYIRSCWPLLPFTLFTLSLIIDAPLKITIRGGNQFSHKSNLITAINSWPFCTYLSKIVGSQFGPTKRQLKMFLVIFLYCMYIVFLYPNLVCIFHTLLKSLHSLDCILIL